MSITDLINKIKGNKHFSDFTYLYLFIVVFVGISAFGLGRLSVPKEVKSSISYTKEQPILSLSSSKPPVNKITSQEDKTTNILSEKRYLASKNGKLYYTVGCSASKRIAEKNIIWFSTSTQAELAGYKLSPSCN